MNSNPLGDYLSERAEDEYVNSEWRREMRELGGAAPEKKRGLVESYKRAGLTEADAKKCVDALATVDAVLVAHTMMTRLQLIPPDEWTEGGLEHGGTRADKDDDEGLSLAFKKGCTTAASFAVFGATPLVAYDARGGTVQLHFNMSVFEATPKRKAPTLRVRPER